MSLPAETVEEYRQLCDSQALKIAHLEAEVQWLKEQFRLAQHRQFGAASEKTSTDQQALVFNEAEATATASVPEPTVETITYQRRKTKGQREAQLKDLPVETVAHRLASEEQVCACCGGPLHELTDMEEVRQELKIEPAKVTVVKHLRYKYGCRRCEHQAASSPIVTAPMPTPAFPNSLASSTAVAFIMSQKFVEGLPLYRQEQSFARLGVRLSRQTLANWMLAGADWLEPVYDRMIEHLLKRDILHADETTLQVLHESGRAAETQSYLWLYRTGRDGPPIICFEYQPTRASAHPIAFLKHYRGYLHVDGYQVYELLPEEITLVGCWSHARRGFTDALTALPASARATDKPPTPAEEGLRFCNRLFAIEREFHDALPAARFIGRLQHSRPVLNAMHCWLERQAQAMLPKSAFGHAVTYCLNQWAKLSVFLQDGRLELDNNRSERSIKPVVIGRKNWLFANTANGAKASAIIYSLVETAKENRLHPYSSLTYLFEQIPDCKTSDLDRLLPWATSLPDNCRLPGSSIN
jgi:transposase